MFGFPWFKNKPIAKNINNPNNTNNPNNMQQEQIIIPGFYREIATKNQQKPNIVRIMGPSPGRPDYWRNADGQDMPEYALKQYWEAMDFVASKKDIGPPKNIFAGLESMEDAEQNQQQTPIWQEPAIVQDQQVWQQPHIATGDEQKAYPLQQQPPVVQQQPENIFMKGIFSKLGGKNEVISLNLNLNLGFDLEKLRSTVNLLDLDINDVTKYIVENYITRNKVNNALSSELQKRLSDAEPVEIKNLQRSPVVEEQIVQTFEESKIETRPENLDIAISEIEIAGNKVLNKYI